MVESCNNPVVSILIPTYNMGQFIEDALCSVLRQDLESFEVIVVDDGSQDETASILQKYTDPSSPRYDARIRCRYQENKGKSAAVNLGFDMARGKYIAILDADDELTRSSLSDRYEALVAGGEKKIAIGGFEVFYGQKVVGRRNAPTQSSAKVLRRKFLISYKTPFSLNNCLIERELVVQTGGFDLDLRRCQDIDYAIRLLDQVEEIERVDQVVYRYRKHRDSIGDRTKYRLWTAYYRSKVMWKHFQGPYRIIAVLYAFTIDFVKMLYELGGVYKR